MERMSPESRRDFWEKLFDLADAGTTILVSTHYMDEAERCHKLAYIAHGKLLIKGTLKEILEKIHAKGYYRLYVDGGRTIQSFLKEDLILSSHLAILLSADPPAWGEHWKKLSPSTALIRN